MGRRKKEDLLYGRITPDNAVEKQEFWAERLGIPVDMENSMGMRFRLIPAGEFMMGGGRWDNARPIHLVKITMPFYMGVYPVTHREWKTITGRNPSAFKGGNRPVELVSWNQVQEFIEILNSREESKLYRLPTEAEWEYSCRSGSEGNYCFGNNFTKLGGYAWYGNNSGDRLLDVERIRREVGIEEYLQRLLDNNCRSQPVGKKKPNRFGIYDMHGNVWEWCQDLYSKGYYKRSEAVDPTGPVEGNTRVFRGGCWSSSPDRCMSSHRSHLSPDFRNGGLGFRLVRGIDL